MMRRLISLMTAVMILFAAIASAEGLEMSDIPNMTKPGVLPIVAEKTELTIAIAQNKLVLDYEDNYMTRLCEEETGLDLVFHMLPSEGTSSAVDELIASGQTLPDVILHPMGSRTAIYGAEGYFHVLNDYFDRENGLAYCFWNEAPGMTQADYDEYLARSTESDGNIYAFSNMAYTIGDKQRVVQYINMRWLDALGLDIPTNMEELYEVLVAFRDNDPNGNGRKDEIPMLGAMGSGGCDEAIINLFTYWNPDYMLNVENDVVWAPFVTEEWQQAMIFLNRLVSEELIPQFTLVFTSFEIGAMVQSFAPGQQIVGVLNGSFNTVVPDIYNPCVMDYDVLAPFEGAYTPVRGASVSKIGHITKDCDTPQIAFRFLDYWSSEKRSLIARHGEPGVHFMYRADDEAAFDEYFAGGAGRLASLLGWQPVYGVMGDAVSPWSSENNVIWNIWPGSLLPAATYSNTAVTAAETPSAWAESQDLNDVAAHRRYCAARANALWYGNTPEQLFIDPVYTDAELDRYNYSMAAVKNYVNECITAFAMGSMDPVKDWEKYLSNLEAAGLRNWLEAAQIYWDRAH